MQKLATRGLGDDTADKSHTKTRRHKYGEDVKRCRVHPAVGGEPLSTVLSQKPVFETLRVPIESVR